MSSTSQRPHPHVLRDYAFLGDGARGVLVGPDGAMVWGCFPYYDSEALFSDLIGGDGWYQVAPIGRFVWGGRYEPRSLIWRSRWVTTDAIIECREALAFPAHPERAVLLRRIVGVAGEGRVAIELRPRAAYGRRPFTGVRHRDRCWLGRSGDLHLRWCAPAGVQWSERDGGRLRLELDIGAGDELDLVLEISTRPFDDAPAPTAEVAWRSTEAAWHREVPALSDLPAGADAELAFALLRGLCSRDGGMVAAATASLPERADTGRSFDYRYAWVRDQAIAAQAVAAHGDHPLLAELTGFVVARVLEDGPRLRPAYTARGGPLPGQSRLDLAGYPGGTDVVGNHVRDQFQLDAFGEALLLFAAAARRDALDLDGWRAVEVAVAAIEQRSEEPGAGIWELDPRRWTHSRLMAVAGLRAVAGVVRRGPDAARWSGLADRLRASVGEDGVHRDGRWQRSPGDERVDAALLLPVLRGACAPGDPRDAATYAAVLDELERDGYVYRYRKTQQPLGDAEGAFMLCGFVTALVAQQLGEPVRAARLFERNRSACGPPGLFAEEYDVGQRQLRGNLPQAFVHALLLESVARLRVLVGGLGS